MTTETNKALDLTQAEARLPRWMVGLAGAVGIGILLSGHVRFSAGFTLGSGLAILNYLWLHQAIEALMAAGVARPARRVLAKFFFRYPLAFAGVYLFYRNGPAPLPSTLP